MHWIDAASRGEENWEKRYIKKRDNWDKKWNAKYASYSDPPLSRARL
jgi:hypothetical protein